MSSITGITTGAQLSAAIAAIAASSPGKIGQFLAFDALFYSNKYMLNGNTQSLTAIEHFVQFGAPAQAMPNDDFDPAFYKAKYADLSGTSMDGADLLVHFLKFGLDEGRMPNANLAANFDGAAYLAKYPDVAAYVNGNLADFGGSASNGALAHYVKFGQYQGFALPTPTAGGTTFTLTDGLVGGLKTMQLAGDQDVRIDFTNKANQITGLDLNGNGVIANDGKENALNVKPASGYGAVDAYTRLDNGVVNEKNLSKVFLGDIAYDGTGNAGDGVKTNGNIVLGGLGADTILGGIGNDFLAGGGVALSRGAGNDKLVGGRNADFMFAELSLLTNTDGNKAFIDGGSTADDTSAASGQSSQDSDWLLLQASDDDEPVTVNLSEDAESANVNSVTGGITTRAGQTAVLKDIENIDASGNTYGFLKGLSATVGGAPVNADNDGIGSSAQLRLNGSEANNIIIGGYDNDLINGGAGNDLLMGGNLNKLIDPNLVGLTGNNDGRDEIVGGSGSDNIVFEADGGIIEGGSTKNQNDDEVDTLWLTANSLGAVKAAGAAVVPVAASDLTTDGVLRFDLGVGKQGGVDNYAGYGGADAGGRGATVDGDNISIGASAGFTADQTNYKAANAGLRVQVQDMENVIATGLGAIDFKAAGANSATDVTFNNQQNFQGYNGNMDLRGTTGANILYAGAGNDKIEGREGNDKLSGGAGDDDFIFNLTAGEGGDGVDVIHRQADVNGDNLWDGYDSATGVGTFVQDFGQQSAVITANSKLTLTLTDSVHPTDLTGFPVNGVAFSLDGVAYTVPLTSGIQGTYAAFTAGLNAALDANPALAALNAVLNANNTITITDPAGKTFVSTGYTFVGNVVPPAGTLTWNQAVGGPETSQTLDRLIYQSYADRADGEKTHDDAVVGSAISLGVDSYAQDLVVSFGADGTRIAEDQSYTIKFTNLTTRDKVSIAVNGVTYALQVGVDLDGNAITNEDVVATNQATIQANFVARLNTFINSFMDNDTAAGSVTSTSPAADTLRLIQTAYSDGEQTVFMTTPVVTLTNLSNGEAPKSVVTNTSQHEVLLFNYDGRNAGLNSQNVLFLGDTNVSRAVLATAKSAGGALNGSEAVLVDGGVDDLAGIAVNTANNGPLKALNFSVHGDDFLIGGDGADIINAGTGDDRVQGSKGADVIDGGKNYYAVKVLGEAEARVLTWNVWEAANPGSAQSLLADPTLAGKTISSVNKIDQTQDGSTLVTGEFNDTLIYAQADFVTGATRFTVTLDNYTVDAGVVNLRNGGAGKVTVDLTGNGPTADDSTSTFTNFENIRTVSGTGLAVAGGGQGNDTLNVAALSASTGGISYDLTNGTDAGKVQYRVAAQPSMTNGPQAINYASLVLKVDGVESVIGGTGNDYVAIDETEAAKDNSFNGGTGTDRIEYKNVFDADPATDKIAQPVVTIKVGALGSDVDMVTMTGGRVGSTVATDTLTGVEFITLSDGTATSSKEADVLDVTALTAGAVVNYIDGTVKAGGVTQVTIDNLYQIETIKADGDDTVIVADADRMSLNSRGDLGVDATGAKNITFNSYLNYDLVQTGTLTNRLSLLELASGLTDVVSGSAALPQVVNNAQFNFELDKMNDTVDYSLANDKIVAVVDFANTGTQFVMVNGNGTNNNFGDSNTDRIDRMTGVENVVASQGKSVLDLTQATQDLKISFSNNYNPVTNYVGGALFGKETHAIKVADAVSGTSTVNMNFIDYVYVDTNALDLNAIPTTARWTDVEGSDFNETVELSGYEAGQVNTLNLRGGSNRVTYEGDSVAITLNVIAPVAATPATTGLIRVDALHTAPGDDHDPLTLVDTAVSATDVITSYSAQNAIKAGDLTIKGARGQLDSVSFAGGLGSKLFVLGGVVDATSAITVKLGTGTAANSISLVGFELLNDADTNDVYDMVNLTNILLTGVKLVDNGTNDHDTILVGNEILGSAVNASGTAIDLAAINAATQIATAGFDFDVLDITKVTSVALTSVAGTAGTTDELVIGKIANVTSALLFESVVFTDASVTENGTSFNLNTTTNKVTAGAKSIDMTNLQNVISFGGTVFEQTGFTLRADTGLNVTTGVTVTVTGTEATSITGGNGADTITGAGGADTIRGGMGNDILDGGFVAEVAEKQNVTLGGGILDGGDVITIEGITIGVGQIVNVVAGASASQIGTAFAAYANVPANLTALSTSLGETVSSVSYDALTQQINFNYAASTGAVAAGLITLATAFVGSTITATVFDNTPGLNGHVDYAARAESKDSFVFEATALLNGADTINNFNSTAAAVTNDFVNVSAFLNAAALVDTAATDFVLTGLDLTGQTAGVVFNKASLSGADISILAGAGKITIADNGKAVIFVTADVDGVSDATANAYNMYYVEDTNASALAQTWTVTLVGTVNTVDATGQEAGAIAFALENPFA